VGDGAIAAQAALDIGQGKGAGPGAQWLAVAPAGVRGDALFWRGSPSWGLRTAGNDSKNKHGTS
jgi:hypothetical protein